MLSRRTILVLSILSTLAIYVLLLWMSPWVILMESGRLAPNISRMYRVDLLESAAEPRPRPQHRPPEGLPAGGIDTGIMDAPGTLPVEDTLAAPPVEIPGMTERMAGEPANREYDLAPEPERVRTVDARILEIAEEAARRDIDIARRLVRPSPDFILPEGSLPALRSRDAAPGDIALEPARLGPGLLVEAMPLTDGETDPGAGTPAPAFDPQVFTPAEKGTGAVVPQLEQTVMEAPVRREAEKAREESGFTFMDDLVDIRLDTYVPDPDEPGYFRLRILPREDAVIEAAPKDVTFILDASRSMQQRKLDLAARGVSETLDSLRPADRFNLLIFRDAVSPFQAEPAYATPENVVLAKQFLTGLESKGQTDVYNGLLPIAQIEPRPNRAGVILLVSDGNPTTGVRDSREIINRITEVNNLRNNIFAYGAGNTANRYLLDLLAYRNKGEAMLSENIQNAQKDLKAFAAGFSDPLLVNLEADYGRIVEEELYPRVIPDFYRQRPITLFGRYQPGKEHVFVARITGHSGETVKELLFRADLSKAETGGKDVARGWAFQKAYHIIGEISRQGELPELLAELKRLSDTYAIRTIYDD